MVDTKTKVIFVVPSLRRGGAETQLIDLVNGLDSKKFEKHLFTFHQDLDQLDKVDRKNIEFHNEIRQGKLGLSAARKLSEIIDKQNIQLIHCTLQISLLVGYLAIKLSKNKPKLVLTLHTTKNRNMKQELFERYFYKWIMKICDQIICVCGNQEKFWQKKYPFLIGKTEVVYNGVDIGYFNADSWRRSGINLRQTHNIPIEADVVVNVAAFRPEKGQVILLRAFSEVLKKRPAYLLLAGEGPLRIHCEQLAKSLGCYDRVRFLGNLSDVRPVVAASTISVMASIAETFSIAMLESMSMKKIIVATDVGGTSEAVLHNKTGLIVPPNDINKLSDGIVKILSDKNLMIKMEESAVNMVKDKFTKDKMISKTSAILMRHVIN